GRRGRRAPAKTMSPLLRTVAEIARRVVVLPAPFAPRTATISPSPTTRSIPCKACNGPYRAATPRSSSRGMLGPLAAQISLDHGGGPPAPPRAPPRGVSAPVAGGGPGRGAPRRDQHGRGPTGRAAGPSPWTPARGPR